MHSFVFFVPMKPRGQGRPRFGNGHAYEARADREAKKLIARFALDAMAEAGYAYPLAHCEPCAVDITVNDTLPKSRAMEGIADYTKKPDVDNVAKMVLDALNGIAYCDDAQVVFLVVRKEPMTADTRQGIGVCVRWHDERDD